LQKDHEWVMTTFLFGRGEGALGLLIAIGPLARLWRACRLPGPATGDAIADGVQPVGGSGDGAAIPDRAADTGDDATRLVAVARTVC